PPPLAARFALALLAPVLAGRAAGAAPVAVRTAPAAHGDAPRDTVTLVTGDAVTVATDTDGRVPVDPEPVAGTATGFRTEQEPSGDTHVIPDSAGEGPASGRLDRELLDVTRLAAHSQGASGSDTLPLSVDHAGAPARSTLAACAGDVQGVTHRTPLTSLGVLRRTNALETSGTRTDTTCTFRSADPRPGATAPGCAEVYGPDHPCAVLPVILFGSAPGVDGDNTARAGRALPVRASTLRPDGCTGPRVTGMRVEASYDDGATRTGSVRPHVRGDGSATAVLHHPRTGAEHVTLRATAADDAGSRTQQTVVRTYTLRR
ncbi:hypothetical protein ACN6LM_006908, partial [Streptomyces sp. SAS_281]